KAQRIEKLSDNHYRAVDSYMTTCCGDKPFYRIESHEIDIYPEEKVVIRNAVMYIMDMPVLYVPYFVQYLVDFKRLPVQVAAGKRSEWGAFVLSKWRYTLAQSPELSVSGNGLLDYRQKRGVGVGDETFYHGDKVGRGAFRYYYADDNKPEDNVKAARSRVQWRHQSKLAPDTMLTTEFNKLSDGQVIKDFFYRDEYERDAFPDNYVSIITTKPEYTLSILDRERLNNFHTVVERSPEIRFDTRNRAFADTPFYLREEAQFTNLKLQGANNTDSAPAVVRYDNNYTLSYADKAGPVSVTPHVGTRQTLYSRARDDDRMLMRGIFDGGIDTSIRFYKVYDVTVRKFGLDFNQLRHIFAPQVSYNYRPNPTVTRTLLAQFDELDSLDKQNFVRMSFENRLQTREHASEGSKELTVRDIARFIPFTDYELHTGRIANLGIQGEFYPYRWMGMQSDATYNTDLRTFDMVNYDVYFDHGGWKVSVGQRYTRDSGNQITGELRYAVPDKWEAKLYERYEFKEGVSKEFEFVFSKYWDCIITDFIYNRREGDTFMVALRLKAFPSTPFTLSQSYNRPKASSQPEQAL
ncbi:MAG: hypothetical protein WCG06_02220, partial [Candidatus Omnitrophota bacterium]